MPKRFKADPFTITDKTIIIQTPNNCSLGICIDYDDVNHRAVLEDLRVLINLLNEHWPQDD